MNRRTMTNQPTAGVDREHSILVVLATVLFASLTILSIGWLAKSAAQSEVGCLSSSLHGDHPIDQCVASLGEPWAARELWDARRMAPD